MVTLFGVSVIYCHVAVFLLLRSILSLSSCFPGCPVYTFLNYCHYISRLWLKPDKLKVGEISFSVLKVFQKEFNYLH